MQLKNLRVTNFRCVEDSEDFKLDRTTCLVGKNEAGKTALLQALHRLKPDRAEEVLDLVRDFPRRKLSDYEPGHAQAPAKVLHMDWELSDEDLVALRQIVGTEADRNKHIHITASYPKDKRGAPSHNWGVAANETTVVEHVLSTSPLHDEEREDLRGRAKTMQQLKAALTGQTERHNRLKAFVDQHFKRDTAELAIIDTLHARMPVFVYFSQYAALKGRVHLESLQSRIDSNQRLEDYEKLFIDLCHFAGSSLTELAAIKSFETLRAKFEAAQTKITSQIFEYWSTNTYLSVQFSRDAGLPEDPPPFNSGNVFNIRIANELHGATVPFDERSTGFVWFFSFLVHFTQAKKRYGDNLMLLLDEPGLNLHAQAQADLLRFFKEKLEPTHQIIYTTHSLFMVPPDNLLCARVVEDVLVERPKRKPEVLGTKVRTDVLSVTKETLFPLQGALGFEISQTLFVGHNTLIVEGPSDLLYLTAYSQTLKEMGRTSLDPRWTICPVGGIDKVPAFLALFGAKLNVAVVVDLATGAKGKVKEAKQLAEVLLKQGRVFSFAEFTNTNEADVEDMLGANAYAHLVSAAYRLNPALQAPATLPGRVLAWLEPEMRLRTDFDHFHPAEHLLLNRSALLKTLPGADQALDRFAALFTKLNAAI